MHFRGILTSVVRYKDRKEEDYGLKRKKFSDTEGFYTRGDYITA